VRQWAGKRYWLIGASEGLGRALAHELSRAGAEVILSARNAERLETLAATLPGPARAVPIDIADGASVQAAAEAAGPVDGMVFLAGVYWPMAATDWDAEKAETMADVNFSGALRCLGAVVPPMVARGAGHIVLTGSLSGYRGLPGAVGYGASKAAVMSLAETLRLDLKDTGVDVQLANPGFIRTRLTDKNNFAMPQIMEPEDAASRMMRLMNTHRFRADFPWPFAGVFRWGRFLPEWAWSRMM
jgi:short-subunit dehydrogenase